MFSDHAELSWKSITERYLENPKTFGIHGQKWDPEEKKKIQNSWNLRTHFKVIHSLKEKSKRELESTTLNLMKTQHIKIYGIYLKCLEKNLQHKTPQFKKNSLINGLWFQL